MKGKAKIFALAIVLLSVVAILTTVVVAGSNLAILNGTSYTSIGTVFELGYGNLTSNTSTYCIQKGKSLKAKKKKFSLTNYIEIDGKNAIWYKDKYGTAAYLKNDANAQFAYILNKQQGYGNCRKSNCCSKCIMAYN